MQLLSASHNAQLPTGLPPSPTLTNPDMILPYSSPSIASKSSITPRESQQHWTQQPRADESPRLQENGQEDMKKGVRRLFGNGAKSSSGDAGNKTPLVEDINGNVRNKEHQSNHPSRERLFLTPSPTTEDQYSLRTTSSSRNIDINNGLWEGFDGPVEEIRADSYNTDANTSPKLEREQGHIPPTPSENAQATRTILDEDEDDPQSHAAMSKRAELILANAKKRLLTMESNLNRARYGLNSRPSSSMSSFANNSPEPMSLYTIPGRQPPAGLLPMKHRQPNSSIAPGSYKGHARVFSETSVPSPRYHGPQTLERDDHQASSTLDPMVVDETTLDSSDERDFDNERNWFWTGLNRNGNNSARINQTLEPLHEDEPAPVTFDSPSPVSNSLSMKGQYHHFAIDQNSSCSSPSDRESPSSGGLTRARSTNQMRDLRDQMQDLKGKISNLKQRAREDSMRRRSLQSLRTPSPFTAAEQWYTGASGHMEKHSHAADEPIKQTDEPQIQNGDDAKDIPSSAKTPQNTEPALAVSQDDSLKIEESPQSGDIYPTTIDEPDHDPTLVRSNVIDNQGELSQPNLNLTVANEVNQVNPNIHSMVDVDTPSNSVDEASTLENSTSPVGERHEDRPDAFDYEHFYLHSSMGHYGRSDDSRTSSHSSMYSVETTRPVNGPVAEPVEIDDDSNGSASNGDVTSRYSGHLRQNSGESVSTVATFATATEGRGSEEETEEEEWVSRRPMAGSWQPDYPLRHKFNMNGQQALTGRPQPASGIKVNTTTNISPNATKSPSFSPNTPTQPPNVNAPSPHSSLDLLSVLSASSAAENDVPGKSVQLNDRDKELVERLIQSLSKVCIKLHNGTIDRGRYENRLWRRRIDAARRVLDGETNGEAF